jgi:hypothetical protein
MYNVQCLSLTYNRSRNQLLDNTENKLAYKASSYLLSWQKGKCPENRTFVEATVIDNGKNVLF